LHAKDIKKGWKRNRKNEEKLEFIILSTWWPSTRIFSWNVFVLTALEVAGLRYSFGRPEIKLTELSGTSFGCG
jgi:hypothetical protein